MRANIKQGYQILLYKSSHTSYPYPVIVKTHKELINRLLEENKNISYTDVRIRFFNNSIKIDALPIYSSDLKNWNFHGVDVERKNPNRVKWTIYLSEKELYSKPYVDSFYRILYRKNRYF
jgi:hypothetical protein